MINILGALKNEKSFDCRSTPVINILGALKNEKSFDCRSKPVINILGATKKKKLRTLERLALLVVPQAAIHRFDAVSSTETPHFAASSNIIFLSRRSTCPFLTCSLTMPRESFVLNLRNGKAVAERRRDHPTKDGIDLCPTGTCGDNKCLCLPKKHLNQIKKKFSYDAAAPFQLKNPKSGLPIVLKCLEGVTDIREVTGQILEENPLDVYHDRNVKATAIVMEIAKRRDFQKQTEWVTDIVVDLLHERDHNLLAARVDGWEGEVSTIKMKQVALDGEVSTIKTKQVALDGEVSTIKMKQVSLETTQDSFQEQLTAIRVKLGMDDNNNSSSNNNNMKLAAVTPASGKKLLDISNISTSNISNISMSTKPSPTTKESPTKSTSTKPSPTSKASPTSKESPTTKTSPKKSTSTKSMSPNKSKSTKSTSTKSTSPNKSTSTKSTSTKSTSTKPSPTTKAAKSHSLILSDEEFIRQSEEVLQRAKDMNRSREIMKKHRGPKRYIRANGRIIYNPFYDKDALA